MSAHKDTHTNTHAHSKESCVIELQLSYGVRQVGERIWKKRQLCRCVLHANVNAIVSPLPPFTPSLFPPFTPSLFLPFTPSRLLPASPPIMCQYLPLLLHLCFCKSESAVLCLPDVYVCVRICPTACNHLCVCLCVSACVSVCRTSRKNSRHVYGPCARTAVNKMQPNSSSCCFFSSRRNSNCKNSSRSCNSNSTSSNKTSGSNSTCNRCRTCILSSHR